MIHMYQVRPVRGIYWVFPGQLEINGNCFLVLIEQMSNERRYIYYYKPTCKVREQVIYALYK